MNYKVDTLKIKSLIALKGLNVTQLFEKVKMSRKTLSDIINGNKLPNYFQICEISKALDMTEEDIATCFFVPNLLNK